ncbi:MAG: FAD binding domain-containing protein [Burkholderiales bacterium]|nr:FAD binding domain-containing protein [Burkholderiales bacterium]
MYDFEYRRVGSIAEAQAALAGGSSSKLLAGGMSLLPVLKQRLARYDGIVDLGGIATLRGIHRDNADLVIGAMTTHATVAASALVAQSIPALAALAAGIGDPQVRNRGTLGGSVANADPAADYPAALLALDARIVTQRRVIAAEVFFRGLFETALEPGEIIQAVHFTLPQRAGYAKLRQSASRFALVGVFVTRTHAGVRVAVTGARDSVFRWREAEAALAADFRPAALARLALPSSGLNADIHASAEYRAHCVQIMAQRALAAALEPPS